MQHRFFALSLLALTTTNALALDTSLPTAWMRPVTNVPYSGDAALLLRLEPDRARCEESYGSDWADVCRRPVGSRLRTEGVALFPQIKGTWRWETSTMLSFTPDEPWPAAKAYRVDFSKLPLPEGVRLSATTLDFTTKPLSLLSTDARFWSDPTVHGLKLITFDLHFSAPVDPAVFEKTLVLKRPDGLRTDPMAYEWSDDRMHVYLRLLVRDLPEQSGLLTLELPKVAAQLVDTTTLRPSVKPGFETARVDLRIPGRNELMYVEQARLERAYTDDFRPTLELTLTPSLRIPPEVAMKNLRVTLLPEKWNEEATDAADWSRAGELSEEVLRRGTPLKFESVGSTALSSDNVRVRFDAPGNRWVHVSLAKGTGPEGAGLTKTWSTVLRTPALGSGIDFLLPGNLLTLSGERTLPFTTRGVERLRSEVAAIRAPFAAQVMQAWNGLSVVRYADELANIRIDSPQLVAMKEGASLQDGAWGRIELPERAGLYQVTLVGERQNEEGEWEEVTRAVRTTLVSDRALLVKETPEEGLTLFDARLTTGDPVAGDEVSILAANGTTLATGKTDDTGRFSLVLDASWTRDRKPVALVVKGTDGDLSMLSLTDPSNRTGAFEPATGGRRTSGETLSGLTFAERGIVRPGEVLRLGALVKTRDWRPLPEGLPLRGRLTGPTGDVLADVALAPDPSGLIEFSYETSETTPSGKLAFDLIAGDTTLSTTMVAVQPFEPETMALGLTPTVRHEGWTQPDEAGFDLTLTGLYGGAAAGRTVETTVTTHAAGAITFERFPGFVFLDTLPFDAQSTTKRLAHLTTDTQGCATFTLSPDLFLGRTARTHIVVQGFEAAGRPGATNTIDRLISPADTMLGWKPEGATSTFLQTDDHGAVRLKLVDRDLQPRAGETIRIIRSERSNVRELVTSADGRATFRTTALLRPVEETTVQLDTQGETLLTLATQTPGDYVYEFRSGTGVALGSFPYTVATTTLTNVAQGVQTPATLRVHLEDPNLPARGTIRATVASPFEGFGLMTLESDRLHASQWVKVKSGDNTLTLPVPEGVEGRAYWRLSLVRAKSESGRLVEPYAEASLPITVALRDRDMGLTAELPDAWARKPSEKGELSFTLRSKTPGKALVWAVDEGILSLTDYRTPDPLARLLLDRALEVGTRQTLSRLMPEGFPYAERLPAFGGDLVAEAGKAMANPFGTQYDAPALWWSGIVSVSPEGTPLSLRLPDTFTGRVRLMAVASSDEKAGHFAQDLTVTAPVVLQLPFPRTLYQGDVVTLPLRITNTTKKPVTGRLQLTGELFATPWEGAVDVAPGATAVVTVPVTAERLGAFTLMATLLSDDQTVNGTTQTLRGTVRPASLWETRLTAGRFTAQTPSVTFNEKLLPYAAQTTLVASAQPVALLANLTNSTPYTRTAALTDALALLPLKTSSKDRAKLLAPLYDLQLEDVTERLAEHADTRNFFYGPATLFEAASELEALLTLRSHAPELVTVQDVREAKTTLEGMLSLDPDTLDDARDAAYALWVLTREGTLVADSIGLLAQRMAAHGLSREEDVTTLLLRAAEREMQMPDVRIPEKLLQQPTSHWSETTLAAMTARVLQTSFADDTQIDAFFMRLADGIDPAMLDEDEQLQAALTLSLPQKAVDSNVTLVCRNPADLQGEAATLAGLSALVAPDCTEVVAENLTGPVYWTALRKGYAADPSAQTSGVRVERLFTLEDGTPVTPLTKIPAGSLVRMTLTITPETADDVLWNVSQLLPAGATLENTGDLAPAGDGLERVLTSNDGVQFFVRTSSGFATSIDVVLRTGLSGVLTVPPVSVTDLRNPSRFARGTVEHWQLEP